MKRFTKPILTVCVLAILVIVSALVLLASYRTQGVGLHADETSETPLPAFTKMPAAEDTETLSAEPLSAEPQAAEPQAAEPDISRVAHTPIHAAVLSNETKATTLDPSIPPKPTSMQIIRPALADSPVAEKWLKEDGITREDILIAQDRLRDKGFPAHMQNDPNLVRQYLPRRSIQAAHVHSFSIAKKAKAGEAIPFSVGGALPDSSFEFTRFVISRDQNIIRILPIGNTTGEAAPGEEIPVTLDGEIEPLPPGVYQIEFPELGTNGSYNLIVE